ncbi:MAG: VOC family protein [Agarilytica sp.]
MLVSPPPKGENSIIPYLLVRNAREAIAFYERAFDANVVLVLESPDNNIAHAEMRVQGANVMLAEELPAAGSMSPLALGGSSVSLLVYVENVDGIFDRVLSEGAEMVSPVSDQFYGDRAGTLKDPYGHVWTIASRIEELSANEIRQRAKTFFDEDKTD